jgi:cytochrome c-type biogenesis protein CcmF
LGGDKEAFGIDVAYNGMENAINYPNNRLLLTLHEGNKAISARPEMYYSERMDGLMRKPFIERRATKDLYFSPEQIKEGESHDQVTISKGQTIPTGQFDLTFTGFTMGEHGETGSGGVTVAANLQLSTGDTTIQVAPALSQESGPDGNSWLVDKPARVSIGGTEYNISINHILADQGAVVLSIPQLASASHAEQLVLDVSRIPLINLVWIGAILIMLGTLLTFLRRRAELYQQPAPETEARHTTPSPTRS